ncbi:MAG: hypothetical protein QOD93_3964, partial [Acetobacteraceae bacterium]|nr:hypothetical protein [Acetobacteraceae bacterium]
MAPELGSRNDGLDRRSFLTLAAGISAAGMPRAGFAAGEGLALIADPADPIVASGPVQWAASELQASLAALRVSVQRYATVEQAPATG